MRGVLKLREERIANDAYYTPQPLADAICRRLSGVLPVPAVVLEPNAGGGSFVSAALAAWRAADVFGEDVAGSWWAPGTVQRPICLALGNPPYLGAEQQVRSALARVRVGGHVAFLLRLSFLAGQKRVALYREHPLRFLIPIAGRPSFTGDGKTDAAEYAVFVWQRGHTGNAELLPPLEWR